MTKQQAKLLPQDATYKDTPYRVMQAIERTIGRKLTTQQVGDYYQAIHQAIDGVTDRDHYLQYGDHRFIAVFNSEQTVIITKL